MGKYSESFVKNRLRELYGKILCEDQGNFTMCYIKEKELILCIRDPKDNIVYGKIISARKTSIMDCLNIITDPRGLFIFSRDLESFVNKVIEKTRYVLKDG